METRKRSLLARRNPTGLTSHGFMRGDRYEIYNRMRDVNPVCWDAPSAAWVVTGYAECVAALKEPRLKADRMESVYAGMDEATRKKYEPLVSAVSNFLLFLDAPAHTRIRGLIQKAFTPRSIEEMRGEIARVLGVLLDEAEARGEMDLMTDLAYLLPVTVMAQMLGVPAEDHPAFRAWTDGLAGFLGELAPSEAVMSRGLECALEMTAYFRKALQRVRARPGADLLSALAAAEEQGDKLSENELLCTAMVLLAAGHETTASLLGSGTLILFQKPELLEQLQQHPEQWPVAVEEMLRMESPIQLTGREATESFTFCGQNLDKGDLVLVALGAANRDPRQFEKPQWFKMDRQENRHIAFSHGAHYCVGAQLARVQAQMAFEALFKRFPTLRAVEEHEHWRQAQVFRGLTSLRVTW